MDMNDKNEFDLDFDFEKEYGFDPDSLIDPEYSEDDLLAEFLGEDLPEPIEDTPDIREEDYSQLYAAEPQNSLAEEPVEEAFSLEIPEEPTMIPEIPAEEEPVIPETPVEPEVPAAPLSRSELRRIKRAKQRRFKEVYLPAILAGITLVLMMVFIIGAVARGISQGRQNQEDALNASKDAQNAAQELDREAERLLAEAEELANGYNFQGAIALLDSFSGELTSYPELLSAKASYSQQLTQVKAWNDPSQITNLSFHVLIADPSRAFTDKGYGGAYNKNFVTTDEFQRILEQLYGNGYVLVDLDDVVTATAAEDGTVTYSANTIYLPSEKTPIMITETMVNYFNYMIDSDDDGVADAGGGGFASRLVVDENGDIKAELVDASGNTVVGDYDLVPILESFIEEHPDFSYQGARALLAVSGAEGIFGYRINDTFYKEKNLDDSRKQDEIAAATKVVQALRDKGYKIGCYTFDNIDYTAINGTAIQNDLQAWFNEIQPVLGKVDIMVFARHIDISDYGTGNKFNVLYSSGFRYFIGASTAPWAEVTEGYFHQKRLLVTGTQMAYASSTFSKYFNSMAILSDQRGTIPT